MLGVQVLHDYKRHIGVGWQTRQNMLIGFQPPGRCTDAHNYQIIGNGFGGFYGCGCFAGVAGFCFFPATLEFELTVLR
jgi:hypothetical protein